MNLKFSKSTNEKKMLKKNNFLMFDLIIENMKENKI